MPWQVDQSRYVAGFSCPWRRLVRYHLNWVPFATPPEILVGNTIHSYLERALNNLKAGAPVSSRELLASEFQATLDKRDGAGVPSSSGLPGWPPLAGEVEAFALANAWVRCVMPWLTQNFEILDVETEYDLDLGNDIQWMCRPDAVLRHRETRALHVLDFKSTRSKADRIAAIHSKSLQSVMNAHAVASRYGEPVASTQIHVLQIGTEQWPTPLTHAYYRAAQPPYVAEDWQPKSRRSDGTWLGKLYRKVYVPEHRYIADWVWSMPAEACSSTVPLSVEDHEPKTFGLKVMHALNSISTNEQWWRERVSRIDQRVDGTTFMELSALFPRTFDCVQYARDCEYLALCFDPTVQSSPCSTQLHPFVRRQPHHPQEDLG